MKVLILTTVTAPYRVKLFNEIGKKCDLTVCFEQNNDKSRDSKWYDHNIVNFKAVGLKGWEKPLKSVKTEIIKYINEKPDLAIAYEYSTMTGMLFMSLCKLKNIPYVINCDGAFVSKSYKDIAKRFFIKRASGCMASGSMAAKYFLNYGAKHENIYFHNFSTLLNKDIPEELPTKEEKKEIKNKLDIKYDKIILSVGQFIHRKGMDVLIKSMKYVSESVGLYIIGGKVGQSYIELTEKYGHNNIHFLDFMKPDKLYEYFTATDLFVLPTREDVWGLVINEAMAKGVPVITTDRCVAGIELIENENNGYLVAVDDIKATAEAINKIIFDDKKIETMGRNNLMKIREYTIEKSADMIFETFNKVLDKR